jgi:hypothetical protein
MTTKRRQCHWTIPNGSVLNHTAADNLHAFAGGFAQSYEEWLVDGQRSDSAALKRQYRLRQLGDVPILRKELDRAEQEAVNLARSEGVTWEAIGKALGVTRQAAQMRFGK